MIVISDCEQGSPRWHEWRRGIPTATGLKNIISPTRCTKSAGWSGYLGRLMADAQGVLEEHASNKAMLRGQAYESNARARYEFEQRCSVQQAAFCFGTSDRNYGFSPDGLVGGEGLLEIKVPNPETHWKYIYEDRVPTEYLGQVYGALYISRRDWIDFFSYTLAERTPIFCKRISAEDKHYVKWSGVLATALPQFIADLNALRELASLPAAGSDKTTFDSFQATAPSYTSETIGMCEGHVTAYF